ncbi:MAG: hypothetical protein ACNA8W_05810 [Bradymonadaceae bacterium]
MICRNAAILEEALLFLDLEALDLERIGDRSVVLPSDQLPLVEEKLHERGIFPRVVAPPLSPEESQ